VATDSSAATGSISIPGYVRTEHSYGAVP
jgi:hypothetical protein